MVHIKEVVLKFFKMKVYQDLQKPLARYKDNHKVHEAINVFNLYSFCLRKL